MARRIDHSGVRYGMLVGIRETRREAHAIWLWRCDCGQNKEIDAVNVKGGHTRSCGCLHKRGLNAVHGGTRGRIKTAEYKTWESMRERCRDQNNKSYPRYGGRGIRVCERWNEYAAFLSDMGKKPGPEYSIDRKDNDGDYEPSNCRWADKETQASNKRSTKIIEVDGLREPLMVHSRRLGTPVSIKSVRGRLSAGWSPDAALKSPVVRYRRGGQPSS